MARRLAISMPLLIALGASVVLMAWRGKGNKAKAVHRELRLEDLYTGYRQNVMAAGRSVGLDQSAQGRAP